MNPIAQQDKVAPPAEEEKGQLTLPDIVESASTIYEPPDTASDDDPAAIVADCKARYEMLLNEAQQIACALDSAHLEIATLHRQHDAIVERLKLRETRLLEKLGKTESSSAQGRAAGYATHSFKRRVARLEQTLERFPLVAYAAASMALMLFFALAAFHLGHRHGGRPEQVAMPGPGPEIEAVDPAFADDLTHTQPAPPLDSDLPTLKAYFTSLSPETIEPIPDKTTAMDPGDATTTTLGAELDIEEIQVACSENACIVIFEFGLFTSMTRLDPDAPDLLRRVAESLKGYLPAYHLTITGHCDTVPVSATAPIADNRQLSEARARIVLNMLKNDFGLPADAMTAVGMGTDNPPYPNDTPENRAKNRTVVLTIMPSE